MDSKNRSQLFLIKHFVIEDMRLRSNEWIKFIEAHTQIDFNFRESYERTFQIFSKWKTFECTTCNV